MAKFMADAVLDAGPTKIATAIHQTVCSGQPANYAAIACVALASKTVTAGDGNGCYAIADDTSGRKVTVAQQSAVPITGSGTATHVCYDDGAALLGGTTCTSQALTSGGTVTVPAHKFGFADPT